MKMIDTALLDRWRLSLRLERNLALIFGLLALMLTGLIAAHWFLVMEPALRAEAESHSSALAHAQVQTIERLLDGDKPADRLKSELQTALDGILLLKDQATDTPFVYRITLRLDYDLVDAPRGSLDLALGSDDCEKCFVSRVPLYHPGDRLLVGVVTCYSSVQFLDHLVADLRAKLLWGLGIILFLILFAWFETTRLLRRVHDSETNLATIFEAAPSPMVLYVDGRLGLSKANDAAKTYLGLEENAEGLLSSEPWLALYAAGLPDTDGERRETRIAMKGDTVRWALVSAKAIEFAGESSKLITLVDVSELKATQDELRSASFTDVLTGLYNRRFLYLRLAKEIDLVKRYGHPLSIILFDLDHFKRINDTFGHRIGDEVLVKVAAALGDCVREMDVVGRYGGEEFLLILPHSGVAQALGVAERLRVMLRECVWPAEGLTVTISGGISQYGGESLDEFVESADHRLYEAKEFGRDRIVGPSS
ncbi:diguanylate cyclase [Thiorhodococcus fuscus]|uniref:diguanylate cyclase n=1 Tax=Thiorhodococcus fuscus TaxID=527200 RepID=A0ABW4Y620_9GAMM